MKYLYVTLYKFEYFRYPFSYITLIWFDAGYNLSILVLRFPPRINGQFGDRTRWCFVTITDCKRNQSIPLINLVLYTDNSFLILDGDPVFLVRPSVIAAYNSRESRRQLKFWIFNIRLGVWLPSLATSHYFTTREWKQNEGIIYFFVRKCPLATGILFYIQSTSTPIHLCKWYWLKVSLCWSDKIITNFQPKRGKLFYIRKFVNKYSYILWTFIQLMFHSTELQLLSK